MHERDVQFERPVTMTTRSPRPDEEDGVHYLFVSRERFLEVLRRDELVEHAEVHGELYGLPRAQLRDRLGRGVDVLVQVDVQGAAALKALLPGATFVFLAPESFDRLESRLRRRESEDDDGLGRRLETARRELAAQSAFDHVVVNREGEVDRTVDELLQLFERERRRPDRPPVRV